MKKISLVFLVCLMSTVMLAQSNTAVYQSKSDVWKNSGEKMISVFTVSLNNSELNEVKNKLEPLSKEVGHSFVAKGNGKFELTMSFSSETDSRYLIKMLVFIGIENCIVENENVEVYSILSAQ